MGHNTCKSIGQVLLCGETTSMIKDMGSDTLAHLRTNIHLPLFLKIICQLVTVPTDEILIPAYKHKLSSHELKLLSTGICKAIRPLLSKLIKARSCVTPSPESPPGLKN